MAKSGKTKLNLGCGRTHLDGYINLDKVDYGQEVIRDVLRGLPFSDEVFEEVRAYHFMEHIPCGEDLFFLMEEVFRVLKSGVRFNIVVPHTSFYEAFYPDHKSYWNEKMVMALVEDPYQGATRYRFKIEHMKRHGIELHIILRKV